jgi:hypothetical protein
MDLQRVLSKMLWRAAGLFAYDEFGDFAPEQTESHEPFADW